MSLVLRMTSKLLEETKLLVEVLGQLEYLLKCNSASILTLIRTNSTLYSATIRCEIWLKTVIHALEHELKGSKARKAIRALVVWPFKAQETRRMSQELQGYTQTFNFALSIEGCQLLLKTSEEVSTSLKNSIDSAKCSDQTAAEVALILHAVSALPRSTLEISHGVKQLNAIAHLEEGQKALDWLVGAHANVKHQAIRKLRLSDTGEWFFREESYKRWRSGTKPVLWCQGKPGAGKSVVLSSVVDTLLAEEEENIGVAYFYCDYSQAHELQTPEAITATFIRQLILQLPNTPLELFNIYEIHNKHGTRPELAELIELLSRIRARYSAVWLLIDGLDELNPQTLDDLIGAIESAIKFASIMFTSRPQSINSERLFQNTLQYTISARSLDLEMLIRSRMGKAAIASRRLRESPGWGEFVDDTVEKLVRRADAMFILVSLQLDMLLRPRTIFEMKKFLDSVPEKLPDFYALTLHRIRARESDLALKVLAWLVKSRRNLKVNELCEALAVENSNTKINTEALISGDDIVEMCCGFATIDAEGVVGLAHATIHEYLSHHLELLVTFDYAMAKTCLNYLRFENFNFQPSGYYQHRRSRNPFIDYAAEFWIWHIRCAKEPEDLVQLAIDLLYGPNRAAMLQAWSDNKAIRFNTEFTALHAAAILGFLPLVVQLINQQTAACAKLPSSESTFDAFDGFGNTPLLYAVLHRHHEFSKCLLDTHAVNPSVQDNTIIRYALEWGNEELLRLMLSSPKLNRKLARQQFACIDTYFSSSDTEQRDKQNVDLAQYIKPKREVWARYRDPDNTIVVHKYGPTVLFGEKADILGYTAFARDQRNQ